MSDGFRRFRHQHPVSFNLSIEHQHTKDVTNIVILSSRSKNCQQRKVTSTDLSPIFMTLQINTNIIVTFSTQKLILKVINQEEKDEQMKQLMYICGSIIGAALVIVTAMKLCWHCMQK